MTDLTKEFLSRVPKSKPLTHRERPNANVTNINTQFFNICSKDIVPKRSFFMRINLVASAFEYQQRKENSTQ